MSDAELTELILMSADQIDAAFEFWLTISFGVLIAVHITSGTIGIRAKRLMCSLYLAGSVIAILSTLADVIQIATYAERLETPLAAGTWNAAVTLLRFIVYMLGTTLIAMSVFRYDAWFDGKRT